MDPDTVWKHSWAKWAPRYLGAEKEHREQGRGLCCGLTLRRVVVVRRSQVVGMGAWADGIAHMGVEGVGHLLAHYLFSGTFILHGWPGIDLKTALSTPAHVMNLGWNNSWILRASIVSSLSLLDPLGPNFFPHQASIAKLFVDFSRLFPSSKLYFKLFGERKIYLYSSCL